MPLFRRSKDSDYREAAKLLADNRPKEAVEKLREILEKNPDNSNARVSLAVGLMQMQEEPKRDDPLTKEAMKHFDLAAESNPDDPVPLFNKGVSLRHLGELEEAMKSFEAVLEREERNALATLHMAEINYELENWDEAIELARVALVRDPTLEPNLGWVRVALRRAGRLDDPTAVPRD
ncbi:tetratricopeptide repeat protein [Candidatus Thorarchaeota archaeon]|nr:MAG: tetratricopeptide repeat protein [Candidatus Thorarchaeota archaeon]